MSQTSSMSGWPRPCGVCVTVVLVACLLVLPCGLAHGASGLRIEVQPGDMHPQEHQRAAVLVSTPTGCSPPRLSASVGRLGRLQRAGARRFRASYWPPTATFPHVGIIAGMADCPGGLQHGWTTVRIWGHGEAMVLTEPNAYTSVRIQNRTFGPVQANESGIARVAVVAAPGVRWAYDKDRRIDLGVPPASHIHLVSPPSEVRADVTTEIRLRAYAVHRDGRPRAKARIVAEVSSGFVGKARRVEAGVYELRWTLPPRKAEPQTITVKLQGETPSVARAAVRSVAGSATAVNVVLDPVEFVAGTENVINATVTVTDGAGNPTPGTLKIHSEIGDISSATQVHTGTYQVTWQLPNHLQGRERADLVAQLDGNQHDVAAEARATVALLPGPPAAVEVRSRATKVAADGFASVELDVRVLDDFGNPARATPVVQADRGEVQRVDEAVRGAYVIGYRPPRVLRPRLANIEVGAGTATHRSVSIELLPVRNRGTVAAKAGLLTSLNGSLAPLVELDAGGWLSVAGENVGLLMQLAYFTIRKQDQVTAGDAGLFRVHTWTHSLTLAASAVWRRELVTDWLVGAGLGGGVTRLGNSFSLTGQPALKEAALVPQVRLHVSVSRRFGPGYAFVELCWQWQSDPKLSSLRGPLRAGVANLGYRFDLL